MPLTRGVGEQVHGPTKEEVAGGTKRSSERAITNSLPKLVHDLLGDTGAFQVLLGWVEFGQATLRTSLGDEDLVKGHMASGSVMLGMTDAP
jgi:hypothetical protein